MQMFNKEFMQQGKFLDKEFDYLRDEWKTASKDSNKMKIIWNKRRVQNR